MRQIFNDDRLIALEDLELILNESFSVPNFNEKGAGSFCKFVQVGNKYYAVLSRRAEKIAINAIRNIMDIINNREIAVPILGGFSESEGDEVKNFALVLPKIEGFTLPSYVYTISKNISLIKSAESISQQAFNALAEECAFINEKSVHIDFHGGNFIFEPSTGNIRMIDLKKRRSYKDQILIKKFIKLSAYDKIRQINSEQIKRQILEGEQIDIDFIVAKNIIKSYIALCKAGFSEEKIALAIRSIYGEKTDIEDFEKRTK